MKKITTVCMIVFTVLFSGCGTTQPEVPKIKTTKYFNIKNVSLHLTQKVKTDIVYHTQKELQELLKNDIKKKLTNKGLLSHDISMTNLSIDVDYTRHFVGDATPISSDSLGYPNMNYTIKAYDGKKLLTTIKKRDMTYQGGFAMNLQVMAGTLRDKKYELEFINALANTIVNNIEEMQNR